MKSVPATVNCKTSRGGNRFLRTLPARAGNYYDNRCQRRAGLILLRKIQLCKVLFESGATEGK